MYHRELLHIAFTQIYQLTFPPFALSFFPLSLFLFLFLSQHTHPHVLTHVGVCVYIYTYIYVYIFFLNQLKVETITSF